MADHTVPVQILQLPGNGDLPSPTYHSAWAAAMDLHAALVEAITLSPSDTAAIPCGIAIALPQRYEAQIRPRSGLALQHAVTVLNSPATIDADYRGELTVLLINHGRQPFKIERGMRIAQLVVQAVERVEWKPVDILPPTARGMGGFGHTGL